MSTLTCQPAYTKTASLAPARTVQSSRPCIELTARTIQFLDPYPPIEAAGGCPPSPGPPPPVSHPPIQQPDFMLRFSQ